jgi:tetratricopeptide (TPR) repeat protein
VLHLRGGVVIFGWRDPARAGGADPLAGWEVDFERLAYRPAETEQAPPGRPPRDARWWDAFWKPAPPQRPPGRDEAAVLLRKAQAMVATAAVRHQRAWEASHAAGLAGAGASWSGPAGVADAALRLNLYRPPIPDRGQPPAFTRMTFALQQKFAFDRGDAPAGTLYAAIRAARRAVAENPNDANAHLVLGLAYAALVRTTVERSWTNRFPQLLRLRQIQASAAFNRAVAINPRLAQAHLELCRLYLSLNILDLAVNHLRAYRELPPRWGGPQPGTPPDEATEAELKRLTEALDREMREFAETSENVSVSDRAFLAARRGLGGQARDLLLKSDVSAFGAAGTELELSLLLQTGRADQVLEWTTPEVRGSLGGFKYHSLRAHAFVAVGEYDSADVELSAMVGPTGRLPEQVGMEVAGLTAKSLLDMQPGGFPLPSLWWRALSRPEIESRIIEISQRLARSADVLVLRGLVALEAGNIDRARDAFRASLALSPNRWGGGQLAFPTREVAWAFLDLLSVPADSHGTQPLHR